MRPGPIQGGMVHPYLRRRRGEEQVEFPSDALGKVLGRPWACRSSRSRRCRSRSSAPASPPGEADRLRRALAAFKNGGTIHGFRERFLAGHGRRRLRRRVRRALLQQIEGFGDYGFPESHAASFALLVYVSAWLKCHHPAAFACALLNSQPMGFYAPAQIVRDAREHGVEVRPVCVNASDWDNTLEPDGRGGLALRLGLRQIKGLRRGRGRLDRRRPRQRLPRRGRDLAAGGHRRRGSWRCWPRRTPSRASGSRGARRSGRPRALRGGAPLPLFAGLEGEVAEASVALPPMTLGEEIVADYTALRLTLRAHPMALLRPGSRRPGERGARRGGVRQRGARSG